MRRNIIAENRLMMEMVSRFLSETPNAVTPEMLEEITSCGVSQDEAFALLMAGMCDVDSYKDREFFNNYFRTMPRKLDPADYLSDPYRLNIPIAEAAAGKCRLSYMSFDPCEAFVCGDITMDAAGREHVPVGYFTEDFIYPALTRGGRIWMTITPLEIETMKPHIARARGRITVLGLGMGYYAYMAAMKDEVTSIDIVEFDNEVISLFEESILPHFPSGKSVNLIPGDAFEFTRSRIPSGGYDYVFCDLWHDAADGMDMYLRLKDLAKLSPDTEFSYWIGETLDCYLKNI